MSDDLPEAPETKGMFSDAATATGSLVKWITWYFRALTACVIAWISLEAIMPKNPIWARITFAGVPLALVFIFKTLPQIRHDKRKRRISDWVVDIPGFEGESDDAQASVFRIGPYSNSSRDRQLYERLDGKDQEVYDWLLNTSQPVLFLTGQSGTGKSSLLSAAVIPRLEEENHCRTIELRGFQSPMDTLREQLCTPGFIWDRPGKLSDLSGYERVERAVKKLRDSRPDAQLLIVIDQFEELLILAGSKPDLLEPTLDFIRALEKNPIPGARLLLTYRLDSEDMIIDQDIVPLVSNDASRENRKIVPPYNRAHAEQFLQRGITLGSELQKTVLDEAVRIDRVNGRIRPITLNLLGKLLQKRTGATLAGRKGKNLLYKEFETIINDPDLDGLPRKLLAQLRASDGARETKRPQTISQLADSIKERESVIEGCLTHLATEGIVRRLNTSKGLGDRLWEISHDFVLEIISRILLVPEKRIGAYVNRFILPLALGTWLLAGIITTIIYNQGAEERAIHELASILGNDAFSTTPQDGHYIGIRIGNGSLQSLDKISKPLSQLTALQTLDLSDCDQLTDLNGLPALPALQTLDLSDCDQLTDLSGLPALPALQTLNLNNCWELTDLNGLPALPALQTLDLGWCIKLTDLNGFPALPALQTLDLSYCDQLTDLSSLSLSGLPNLKAVYVIGSSIENFGDLPEHIIKR